MSVSTEGEYAVRALLRLALAGNGDAGGAPLKSADIARQEHIPSKYLQHILLRLKKEGFLQSKPGLNGGYFLARPAREITMADVIRAVDGPLAPMRCVSETAYTPCTLVDEATCALRTVWHEAREAMVGVLGRITLEEVAARARRMAPPCCASSTEGDSSDGNRTSRR